MKEGKIFRRGIPYEPDIEKLGNAFGNRLVEGTQISYHEIEEVLSCDRNSRRFDGVVNAWRKRLFRDNGIDTKREGGAVIVMRPHERMVHASNNIASSFRRSKRWIGRFMAVPRERLDEVGQKVYDHKTAVLSRFTAAIDSAKMELTINLPPPRSMPAREALQQ